MQSTRTQIREERKKAKVTQFELASVLGVERRTLGELERGKVPVGQEFTDLALSAISEIAKSRVTAEMLGFTIGRTYARPVVKVVQKISPINIELVAEPGKYHLPPIDTWGDIHPERLVEAN